MTFRCMKTSYTSLELLWIKSIMFLAILFQGQDLSGRMRELISLEEDGRRESLPI
jgi:hypothetical protein